MGPERRKSKVVRSHFNLAVLLLAVSFHPLLLKANSIFTCSDVFGGSFESILFQSSDGLNLEALAKSAVLGKDKLTPDSPNFRYVAGLVAQMRKPNQLPSVGWSALQAVERRRADGKGNGGILQAKLNGRAVIVKLFSPEKRSEKFFVNEARWLLILNKIGLGPEFYGVTQGPNGEMGLVMDRIEGQAFPVRERHSFRPDFSIQLRMLQDILNTGLLLAKAGLQYTPDIQFILTPEGRAILIDPEFFAEKVPLNPPLDPAIMPYDPIFNTRSIAGALAELAKAPRRVQETSQSNETVLPSGLIIVPR
jgi:hypothetical protein